METTTITFKNQIFDAKGRELYLRLKNGERVLIGYWGWLYTEEGTPVLYCYNNCNEALPEDAQEIVQAQKALGVPADLWAGRAPKKDPYFFDKF